MHATNICYQHLCPLVTQTGNRRRKYLEIFPRMGIQPPGSYFEWAIIASIRRLHGPLCAVHLKVRSITYKWLTTRFSVFETTGYDFGDYCHNFGDMPLCIAITSYPLGAGSRRALPFTLELDPSRNIRKRLLLLDENKASRGLISVDNRGNGANMRRWLLERSVHLVYLDVQSESFHLAWSTSMYQKNRAAAPLTPSQGDT